MAVQPEREPSRGHLPPQKARCAAILRRRYQPRNKAAPPASPDELIRPRALLQAWTGRTTRRKSTHKERLFGSSHLGLSHKKNTYSAAGARKRRSFSLYVRFVPGSRHSTAYSITSSAVASSPGGTVKPSAFAVLRLITVSNFVGACTGRSAGFCP